MRHHVGAILIPESYNLLEDSNSINNILVFEHYFDVLPEDIRLGLFAYLLNSLHTYQGALFSPPQLGHRRQAFTFLSRSCDIASYATTHWLCQLPRLPH